MRNRLGETQSEFAERYHIPFRTIQNWEAGVRVPPAYITNLLENRVRADLVNRRTAALPKYDPKKKNLPKRSDYVGALAWLKAIQICLGENVVFALDEALMCQGSFGGRSDEYVVWIYGDDETTRYNGVVQLGTHISPYSISEKNGLKFTNFNRTLSDALANEAILDMQGITEAVSKYYYSNGESFEGLSAFGFFFFLRLLREASVLFPESAFSSAVSGFTVSASGEASGSAASAFLGASGSGLSVPGCDSSAGSGFAGLSFGFFFLSFFFRGSRLSYKRRPAILTVICTLSSGREESKCTSTASSLNSHRTLASASMFSYLVTSASYRKGTRLMTSSSAAITHRRTRRIMPITFSIDITISKS